MATVAAIVCSALDAAGHTAVLTGGGAATVYSSGAYQSRDLDFVFAFWSEVAVPEAPLLDLGYRREGRSYVHPLSPLTLDFPTGPLAVGEDLITRWETLNVENRKLHILSPTDCVRDRLSAFYHWNDFSSLEQALLVARQRAVDLEVIREWSVREGCADKADLFLARLAQSQGGV